MSDLPRASEQFLADAAERIDGLGRGVLQLAGAEGGAPSPELINELFREAHTLKGLAAMFSRQDLAELAHRAEEILEGLRLGRLPLAEALVDALLALPEALHELLAHPEDGRAIAAAHDLAARLREASADGLPGTSQAEPLEGLPLPPELLPVLTGYERHRLAEAMRSATPLWRVRVWLPLESLDLQLAEVVSHLAAQGEHIATLPSAELAEGSVALELLVAGAQAPGEVEKVAPGAQVVPLWRPSAPRAVPAPAAGMGPSVRVSIGRLDALMNVVAELSITEGALSHLADRARAPSPRESLPRWAAELVLEVRSLSRRLTQLQQGLLDARMIPLAEVFERLARLSHRLAREAGKEVQIGLEGSATRLDKRMVEALSDPLLHLLRNAIDHGIEPKPVRQTRGKPAAGRIVLRARSTGDRVTVEVQDDGAGIDPGAVTRAAVARGWLTPEQAPALPDSEVYALLFRPGLSTAAKVSSLSGRGVGLDVVATNVAQLSGAIEVTSSRGRGSTFSITVPVTLALQRALLVAAAGHRFALPLTSAAQIVPGASFAEGRSSQVLRLRGSQVKVARLAELLSLPQRGSPPPQGGAVVVLDGQARAGVWVDQVLEQRDIVIQPLGPHVPRIVGVSGATVLGDRSPVLVLDGAALREEVLHPAARP